MTVTGAGASLIHQGRGKPTSIHCYVLRRAGAAGFALLLALLGISACTPATVHVLDWGVLDKTTNTETDVGNGGSLKIQTNDTYLVTLRVQDPAGIKSMSTWADGTFTCSTDPDANGTVWTAPDHLSAGVARTDNTLPSSASTRGFVFGNRFVYHQLDCGVHRYQGPPGPQRYFVTDGTLHFHGAEADANGAQTTATLDLAP